jgi:cytochrome bd-type quinol oxidase subunit 1
MISLIVWICTAIAAGLIEEKVKISKPAVFGVFLGWYACAAGYYIRRHTTGRTCFNVGELLHQLGFFG